MLRLRGLLIAVAVLAALAGGVYWSNTAKEVDAKKPPAADASAPKLIDLQPDRIAAIEIRRNGGETTAAERRPDGKWRLTSPLALGANQGAVQEIAGTLSTLTADRVIEQKAADLGAFGLATPTVDVTFTLKDGKSRQLSIGDELPTGTGYYAKLAGDPRVFTLSTFNKTSVDKTERDLRDKRLLTFDYAKLSRIELVEKGQTIEFDRNSQNEWQILKPRPMRADGGLVDELIGKLRDAEMDTSVSDEDAQKAEAAFAGGTPVSTVRVTDANGTQQLQVRKNLDKFYVRSSVVEGSFKVIPEFAATLSRGLADFRSKKIFDFGWSEPSRIDIREGAKSVTYARSGQSWSSGGKPMDSMATEAMVDKLRELTAVGFPEKGFSTPFLEVSIASSDGKRVEKASFSKTGDNWCAMREGEPVVYQLDPGAVGDLQAALAAIKPAQPAKK